MSTTAPAQDGHWVIGRNVPWVAPWSGEFEFTLAASIWFPGQPEVVQKQAPGVGHPVLDGMHVIRQREGVVRHLCHLCGRPTPRHDRWLFPQSSGALVTLQDGRERFVSHVPPLHLDCARIAAEACPHLRRVVEEPLRFPAKDGEVVFNAEPPAHLQEIADTLPPGLKVAFAYARIHTAAFSREVARARERG